MPWYCSWFVSFNPFCPKPVLLTGKCNSMLEMYAVAVHSDNALKVANELIECYDSKLFPKLSTSVSQLKRYYPKRSMVGPKGSPWSPQGLEKSVDRLRVLLKTTATDQLTKQNGECWTARELHAVVNILIANNNTPTCADWAQILLSVYDASKVPQLKTFIEQLQKDQNSANCNQAKDRFIEELRKIVKVKN